MMEDSLVYVVNGQEGQAEVDFRRDGFSLPFLSMLP